MLTAGGSRLRIRWLAAAVFAVLSRVLSDARLRGCLAEAWGLPDATISALDGGMNSATWLVASGEHQWVAKAVMSSRRDDFEGGLAVAAEVAAAGVRAGAPVATRDGRLVVDLDGVPVGLLAWVPGEPLTGADAGEQWLIGATLARVHQVLQNAPVAEAQPFFDFDLDAAHLSIRPWIRGAVAEAFSAYRQLEPLSHGLLHTDPAPEAFRLDRATGECGLIDWGVAMTGPLLYDLASAVMYVGGPDRAKPLVSAYLDWPVLTRAEVERGLPVMLRFRWAIQAHYFAHRITQNDLTGIAGPAENEAALEHARQVLMGTGTD